METQARWRPVLGYEGVYEVSDRGRVRRCDGYHGSKRHLKPAPNRSGYLNVNLSRYCKGRTFFVHRLVCEAFLGVRPDGMTINHKNGQKTDNRLENLEYMTHANNMRHAMVVINSMLPTRARGKDNGSIAKPERLVRGSDVATAKLNAKVVRQIRAMLAGGMKQRDIASAVGISQTQIWRVKAGLSWAHVD